MAFYPGRESGPLPQALAEYRAPSPTGTLIAIGGEADQQILSRVVESVAKGGNLYIATLASFVPNESFEHNNGPIVDLGAESLHIKTQAELMQTLGKIDSRSALFLGGGNQQHLMQELRNSGQDQLRQAYKRGITIAGTSAGAMVMGEVAPMQNEDGEIKIIEGLGLIPGVAIDTHVDARDRIGRLRQVVRNRGVMGIGLDEGTGFITIDGQEIEIIGKSKVHIVHVGGESDLVEGERYDISSRQVTRQLH